MSASIEFFAGPNDDRAMRDEAASIGLRVVPMLWDRRNDSLEVAGDYPACFFTFLEIDQLRTHGTNRVITDATNPVIEFSRSVYAQPNLIAGRIYWSDDVEEFGRQTKSYFRKLVGWIRKNWRRREDGYYIGPEAERLVEAGTQIAYVHPNTTVRQVRIS